MNIRLQLRALIFIALLALLTMIGVSVYGLRTVGAHLANVNNEALFYQSSVDNGRQAQVEFQRQVQEWKNILIRGNDPEQYAKYYAQFSEQGRKMEKKLEALKAGLGKHGDSVKAVEQLILDHKELESKYNRALQDAWVGDDAESGKKVDLLLRGIDRDTSKGMDTLASTLQKTADASMASIKTEADAQIVVISKAIIAVSGLSLILLVVVSIKIYRNIIAMMGSEPVYLVTIFKMLAKGDFTGNITVREGDKTSMTAQIALMQRKMRNMVLAIKNGTGELETLTKAMADSETPMSPKKFAELTGKAVEGLNEAVDRFSVGRKDA